MTRVPAPAISWALIGALSTTLSCDRAPEPRPAPVAVPVAVTDPLPSWNDGVARKALLEFVRAVTTEGSADVVPGPQRVATFDNDGTLWSEQPIYFQVLFAMDRVRAMAADHPEWKTRQPFKAVIDGDMKAVAAAGEKG